ncbi:HAD family hydrolase [Zunongwangia sp. H14]|uniref:HAD family hydrolase n=1 Tax=Zunongwangia sp. H14 TaxID=3240792 RepID=UPI0035621340
MKKIVVYDLNKTLYNKSSKDEFFKFICYKKGYKLLHLFQLSGLKLMGKMKVISKTFFKENFYNYLKNLPPDTVKRYAEEFWNMEFPDKFREKMLSDIKKFKAEDVEVYIITGGFEVYTKYLEDLLPVKVLGTKTEFKNGNYEVIGKACNDQEKVRRLQEDVNGEFRIIEAYSDDKEEILELAENAYLVDEDGNLEKI